MDKDKFNLILNRLLELTKKKQLDWKTTGNPATFLLALEGSAISINAFFGSEDSTITFEFRNERGEIVESFSVQLKEDKDSFEKASKIYQMANNKALNSDEVLNHILKQLSSDSIAA